MIGHLYRYPHPLIEGRWIYVGQGPRRHKDHRSGRSSFGRRFKKMFPGTDLPYPVREEIEVENALDLNEIETIQMFQYHTWRGYEGGMNLTFPGSKDYNSLGRIDSPIRVRNGRAQGLKNANNGHMSRLGKIYGSRCGLINGPIFGRKNVENGHLDRIRPLAGNKGITAAIQRNPNHQLHAGNIGRCIRWNIKRGKSCVCGNHVKEGINVT
jgi:hypothetical protein